MGFFVTWPEIVVVGIVWVLASFCGIIALLWRIEANTKAMSEIRTFFEQKNDLANSGSRKTSEQVFEPPQYKPEDVAQALALVRAAHGKTTIVATNFFSPVNVGDGPVITFEEVEDDEGLDELVDEHDEKTVVDAKFAAHVADEEEDNRKTIEMFTPPNRSLDVLRHVDEVA